jgi:hypothetical protein
VISATLSGIETIGAFPLGRGAHTQTLAAYHFGGNFCAALLIVRQSPKDAIDSADAFSAVDGSPSPRANG